LVQGSRDGRKSEIEKFRLYKRTRDPKLRDELVTANIDLARRLAQRYTITGEPFDDLFQEACIGLIKAVERYDPDRDIQFNTYATHVINGHLRHYLRDFGKLIKEPAWLQEKRYKVNKAIEELQHKLHRHPTAEEIAKHTGLKQELVEYILGTSELFKVESLDEIAMVEEGEEVLDSQLERMELEGVWSDIQQLEERISIEQALSYLNRLQRRVIELFFYKELTKTEIARMLGKSVNDITYLLKRGLQNLREILTSRGKVGVKRAMEGVDEVTRFLNERQFLLRLEEDLRRAQRYEFPITVAYIISTKLQQYHRRWRSRHFNTVLSKLAELIRSNLREVDYVARMGVNTFAVALPHTDLKGASKAMERLRRKVETTFDGATPEKPEIDFQYGLAETHAGRLEATELLIKAENEAKEAVQTKGASRKAT